MYPDGFDAIAMRHKPICGILAVAIAANVSYDVAKAALKRNMPDHRKRFRGSTYPDQQLAALRELGVKFTEIEVCCDITVMQFCEIVKDDNFIYLLWIRGHIMALRDGCIIDQARYMPWSDYYRYHPRIKLKRVVRIDGKGW